MNCQTSRGQLNGDIKADVVIVGAGISGLVVAYRLQRAGIKVLVLESSSRSGGVIESLKTDGYLIERGPNSIRGTREFLDLIAELGIEAQLVTGDPRLPAFTYSRGALRPVPMSLVAALSTDIISTSGKLGLLKEPFIRKSPPGTDESIAAFIRRRLGGEILDELVTPFISGVYAGDPEMLSVSACLPALARLEQESGSISAGLLRSVLRRKARAGPAKSLRPYRLCTFRDGLSTLTDALARKLERAVRFRAHVNRLALEESEREGYTFRIDTSSVDGLKQISARSVVVATPAPAAAAILVDIAPRLSRYLDRISYNSLLSIPIGFHAEELQQLSGFGFLAAKGAGLRTLGSIWNSSAFADRAKAGYSLMTSFLGGTMDPGAITLTDEAVRDIVARDLSEVFRRPAKMDSLPITRYGAAIPQYQIGHSALVAEIELEIAGVKRLHLAGNYLRGVSVGDCIRNSIGIAQKIELGLREAHTMN